MWTSWALDSKDAPACYRGLLLAGLVWLFVSYRLLTTVFL